MAGCPFCGEEVTPWRASKGATCMVCGHRLVDAPETRRRGVAWAPRIAAGAVALALLGVAAFGATYLWGVSADESRVLLDRTLDADDKVRSVPFVLDETSQVHLIGLSATGAPIALIVYSGPTIPFDLDEGTWKAPDGARVEGNVTLTAGAYGVVYICGSREPCKIYLRLEAHPAEPDAVPGIVPAPPRDLGACAPQSASAAGPMRPLDRDLDEWQPPLDDPPKAHWLYISSPEFDPIGGGQELLVNGTNLQAGDYARGVGVFAAWTDARGTGWQFRFSPPEACTRFEPGLFTGLSWYPNDEGALFAIQVGGGPCEPSTGMVLVDEAAYDSSGKLTKLVLRFAQACRGGPALLGKFVWDGKSTYG